MTNLVGQVTACPTLNEGEKLMSEKWYERYPLRVSAEKIIMQENYPQFVLKADAKKQLFWDGLLQTNFGSLYRVNISYPANLQDKLNTISLSYATAIGLAMRKDEQ